MRCLPKEIQFLHHNYKCASVSSFKKHTLWYSLDFHMRLLKSSILTINISTMHGNKIVVAGASTHFRVGNIVGKKCKTREKILRWPATVNPMTVLKDSLQTYLFFLQVFISYCSCMLDTNCYVITTKRSDPFQLHTKYQISTKSQKSKRIKVRSEQ